MKRMICRPFMAALLVTVASTARATDLVYVPVNPSFGGNPMNGSNLLANAQAQNNTKDTDLVTNAQKSSLQQFNDTLQRTILSRVAAAATQDIVNSSGQLVPGTIETSDFQISIVAVPNSKLLTITTTDKTSGQVTSFQVGQ